MHMHKRRLIGLLLPALMLFNCSLVLAGEKEPKCIDLLIGKCRQCHYLTRICQSLDQKSRWSWRRTIGNMMDKGAEINTRQEERILSCLVDKAPDVVGFCANPPPLSSMPPLKYPDGVKTKP